jgi:protein CpxP
MRLQPSRLALMAAAVLTLTTAAVAVAQDGPPPGPPPMGGHGPGGSDGWGGGRRQVDPEAHAQHLRDVLQLRVDQDGALKAYLAATGPRDWKKDGPRRDVADGPRKVLTTPERLDRETERLTQRQGPHRRHPRLLHGAVPQSEEGLRRPGSGGRTPRSGMRRAEFRHFKGGPGGLPAKPPKAD